MPRDKPPTGSLYPRESYVCFFIFLVELASVSLGFFDMPYQSVDTKVAADVSLFPKSLGLVSGGSYLQQLDDLLANVRREGRGHVKDPCNVLHH